MLSILLLFALPVVNAGQSQGQAQAQLQARAQEMEPASEIALLQTQELLRDPKARHEAVKKDAKACDVDAGVRKIAGSQEAAEAIYDLSADVMETVTREAGGDSEKMRGLLIEALKNPEAFVEKFTPEQKAKLKAIAARVPDPSEKKKAP
jgi:hypothetical protein